MRRILFITNRNILTTSGELRLIKNRAEALYYEYGIPTDFIAFASKERIHSEKQENISAGGGIQTFELSLSNPVITISSYRKLKAVIYGMLQTEQYAAVILSGTVMPSLAKEIRKKFNVKIYLDIHGALEDILEVSQKASGIKAHIFRMLYHVDHFAVKNGILNSDGVFVVTEALEKYLRERFPIPADTKFYIVPCATSTTPIDEEEYLADRKFYRKKYDISDEEIVFVYSGGVSTWQCVSESIKLYKLLSEKLKKKTRMLMFSHNINEIKEMSKGDERIQTDSYPPEELFHALRAGDFAFLLRKDNLTNNVAFPNKFLEYVQSGMRIITTPYVIEIAKQVRDHNLGYIYNFGEKTNDLIHYINENSNKGSSPETINSVLTDNCFHNTTRAFAREFLEVTSD